MTMPDRRSNADFALPAGDGQDRDRADARAGAAHRRMGGARVRELERMVSEAEAAAQERRELPVRDERGRSWGPQS